MRIIGGMTTRMKRGTATHPVSAWRDLTMKTSAGTIVNGGTSPEKPSLVSWCYTANHPVSCAYILEAAIHTAHGPFSLNTCTDDSEGMCRRGHSLLDDW